MTSPSRRPLLARVPVALLLALAACADDLPPEADSLGAISDDPAKADSATPITIVGALALEDAAAFELPVVPAYLGVLVIAPAGADLTVSADGRHVATRVTAFGPRNDDGSYGDALGSEPGTVRFVAPADGTYLIVPQPLYVGQHGTSTVRVTCSGTSCLGACGGAAAPSLGKRTWAHTTRSPLVTKLGDPRHRAYDQIVAEGSVATLGARFTYGAIDEDLEDENVDLWVRTCPGWRLVGSTRTDNDGRASIALPEALAPGDYDVLWHVPGDNSTASGVLSVWEPGRAVVVSDIDGTLTTNDAQVFEAVFLGTDPAQYADAQNALQILRRKGYRIEYLTGRPELLGRMTKAWLVAHGFPAGPTILTSETLQALPTESGVGDFKTGVLGGEQSDVGVWLYAAFGNATTDISAYQANDIPNDHIFIIGPHAGEEGTTEVSSYTKLLPTLRSWPDAPTP